MLGLHVGIFPHSLVSRRLRGCPALQREDEDGRQRKAGAGLGWGERSASRAVQAALCPRANLGGRELCAVHASSAPLVCMGWSGSGKVPLLWGRWMVEEPCLVQLPCLSGCMGAGIGDP